MECSGSVCSSYRKNRLKRVSILVFRWNALEGYSSRIYGSVYRVSILVFRWNALEEFEHAMKEVQTISFQS